MQRHVVALPALALSRRQPLVIRHCAHQAVELDSRLLQHQRHGLEGDVAEQPGGVGVLDIVSSKRPGPAGVRSRSRTRASCWGTAGSPRNAAALIMRSCRRRSHATRPSSSPTGRRCATSTPSTAACMSDAPTQRPAPSPKTWRPPAKGGSASPDYPADHQQHGSSQNQDLDRHLKAVRGVAAGPTVITSTTRTTNTPMPPSTKAPRMGRRLNISGPGVPLNRPGTGGANPGS